MLKFSDSSIRNVIDISKNHIENFQLDSTEGTKRTKAKFRTMAISQRNSYVRKKIEEFSDLKLKVIDELKNRYNQLMPVENESFKKLDSYSEKLFKLVNLKSCMSDSFKLGLDFYVAKISNETSNVPPDIFASRKVVCKLSTLLSQVCFKFVNKVLIFAISSPSFVEPYQ